MTSRSRAGLTLLELMIVIGIILVLAGVLMPVLSLLRNMKCKTATMSLVSELAVQIDNYVKDYGHLGDNATAGDNGVAFCTAPWFYLYTRNVLGGSKAPYIDQPVSHLVQQTSAGLCQPVTDARMATHLCDGYGNSASNVLLFTVTNISPVNGAATQVTTSSVQIRSCAGTPSDTTDDIVYQWDNGQGIRPLKPVNLPAWDLTLTLPGGSPPTN